MTKKIYMSRPSDFVNQHFINPIINEQHLIWDKNDLYKYKKIYPLIIAWILLESEIDFLILQ